MQGDNAVAVLSRIVDEIQWPLTKDEAAEKLDHSHYFSFRALKESANDSEMLLNYGFTIASKGQDDLLKKLDEILEKYSSFSEQKVEKKGKEKEMEVLDGSLDVAMELSPADLKSGRKKEVMGLKCQAYGIVAKLIVAGLGQLIKGILWCGDVTVDRLKWGTYGVPFLVF